MSPIPQKIRKEIDADPFYKFCSLHGYHECGGSITMEHTIIYAGKQLQKKWAIIPVCSRGQDVNEYQDSGSMDKNMNRWVALNRATDQELLEVSKAINYIRERDRLNKIYGIYSSKVPKELL